MVGKLLLVTLLATAWTGSAAIAQAPASPGCGWNHLAEFGISELSRKPAEAFLADGSGPLFEKPPRIRAIGEAAVAAGFPRAGDFLLEIDGLPVTSAAAAQRYAALSPGEAVHVKVRRRDSFRAGTLVVGERCAQRG